MTVTIDIVDQQVFGVLRAFLTAVLPNGIEVVQAQDNRVAMPLGGFVTMNNAGKKRLATNVSTYTPTGSTKSVQMSTRYDMQLDFYGPLSESWAQMAQALFRDEFAVNMMPANIQPLYADDPMQIPLIDGEQQYEQRWKLTATMQYNPIVTVSQDFADTLTVIPAEVDATFPP